MRAGAGGISGRACGNGATSGAMYSGGSSTSSYSDSESPAADQGGDGGGEGGGEGETEGCREAVGVTPSRANVANSRISSMNTGRDTDFVSKSANISTPAMCIGRTASLRTRSRKNSAARIMCFVFLKAIGSKAMPTADLESE